MIPRAPVAAAWLLAASGCAGNAGERGTATTSGEHHPKVAARAAVNPPLAPGNSRTTLEGCLDAPLDSQRSTTPPTPTSEHPGVVALPQGREIRIKHTLNHPCCLTGAVTTQVQGDQVTVTEELSGTPCRCTCSSVLTTRVALPLGTYEVRVLLRQLEAPALEVFRSHVTLQGLRPAADPPAAQ